MKRTRIISLTAGLLFVAGGLATTACSKKDERNNKAKAPKTSGKKVTGPAGKTTPKPDDGKAKAKSPAGDGYAIKFDRPVKVGFKYHYTNTGKQSRKILMGGKPTPGNVELTYDYAADVTVKKVNDKGSPTVEEHKVDKCEAEINGKKQTVLKKGQVVVATLVDGKKQYKVDGKDADPATAKVLGEIIDLDEDMDTDKVFDVVGKKKKVGDSWEPNKAELLSGFAKKLKDAALPLKAENISGSIKLTGVGEQDGIKVLNLSADVTLKKAAPKMGPIKVTDGSIHMTHSGWIPQDPASTAGDFGVQKVTMHFEGEFRGKKLIADMEQEATEKRLAVK